MTITTGKILDLLQDLIRIPAFSRDEDEVATHFYRFLKDGGLHPDRFINNIFLRNKFYDGGIPTILLNSHLDTVKPNKDWSRDPFTPGIEKGRLYGLGSNDAGGSLVALLASFLHFYEMEDLKYNLIFLASAEEEVSGKNGVETALKMLPPIEFGIVGEPTSLQMAVAERGLMVVDCVAHGRSGHAARDEGDNAIYRAMEDVKKISNLKFPESSKWLGPAKATVTLIQAGTQHNVVPDQCRFTVDVRSTDVYSNEEILGILKDNLESHIVPRSLRLRSSSISGDHVLVKTAEEMGITLFGSSTLSDQALMNFPTVKIGPSDSARSHTADEFILVDEIRKGIALYTSLIERIIVN